MMAIRFEPNERRLATLYDRPSPGFRLTRKTLLACVAVGLLYAGFGVAVMSYKITHKVEPFVEPPVVQVDWTPRTPLIPKNVDPAKSPPPIHTPTNVLTFADPVPFAPNPDATTPTDVVVDLPLETIPTTPTVPVPPRGPLMIKNPDWVSKPTAAQLGRVYPDRAAAKEMSGAATLLCGVATDGSMAGCAVIDESPKGWRFGEAALAAARYFKMSPRTVDGQVVEGAKVRIPIVFNLG